MVFEGDIREKAVGLAIFKKNLLHIVKICGQYVGLDLTFYHKNVHTYVTYISRYIWTPLQA